MRGAHFLKSIYSPTAALDSYYLRLRKLRSREMRCVMIIAMPKTSSTFFTYTLAKLLNYRHSYFASSYFNIEQELYQPHIVDWYGKGTVVQQHFRANVPNLRLLNRYGIRPTILVRNIYDVVASLRDHLIRERLDNIPSLYPPTEYRELPMAAQFDFVIRYYVPWLLSFYASWVEASRQHQIDLMWLTYEECSPDYAAAIRKILRRHSLTVLDEAIDEALQHPSDLANRRFNRGVCGRGRVLLSPEQVAEIDKLASFYPSIDFAGVGIARSHEMPVSGASSTF